MSGLMEKPDLNKVFSLNLFLKDLLADLMGAELSWDLTVSALWNRETKSTTFHANIPINLYGDRKEWLLRRITDVSMKHGLHLFTDWKTADFCLCGTFSDVQGRWV